MKETQIQKNEVLRGNGAVINSMESVLRRVCGGKDLMICWLSLLYVLVFSWLAHILSTVLFHLSGVTEHYFRRSSEKRNFVLVMYVLSVWCSYCWVCVVSCEHNVSCECDCCLHQTNANLVPAPMRLRPRPGHSRPVPGHPRPWGLPLWHICWWWL